MSIVSLFFYLAFFPFSQCTCTQQPLLVIHTYTSLPRPWKVDQKSGPGPGKNKVEKERKVTAGLPGGRFGEHKLVSAAVFSSLSLYVAHGEWQEERERKLQKEKEREKERKQRAEARFGDCRPVLKMALSHSCDAPHPLAQLCLTCTIR